MMQEEMCVCMCVRGCVTVCERDSQRESVFMGVSQNGGVTKGSNLCVYVFSCVNCIMSSGEHIVNVLNYVSETP